MKKLVVEFIGTFFLILTIVLTVNGNAGQMAPIAIGGVLMVMIFAGGHISGGHYNPAVTLGVWIRGKIDAKEVPGYMVSQTLGGGLAAILGGHLLQFMSGTPEIVQAGRFDFLGGAIAEFLGTFALVWTVLHVATAKGTKGNSFYGLAIGFSVTCCAYGLGGITGGAFNPAVALGISIVGMTTWGNIGAFLVGQLLAGVLAAALFKYVNGAE